VSSSSIKNACYGGEKEGNILTGCVNGCLDYDTLDNALKECTRLEEGCGGVVLAPKTKGGNKSRGAKD